MIDVIQVFNIVRDLANRDQKGFVSPTIFNEFLPIVQDVVYNELFKERLQTVQLRRGRRDDVRSRSLHKMIDEHLKPYIVNLMLVSDTDTALYDPDDPDNPESAFLGTLTDDAALTFIKPQDLHQDIQMVVTGTNTVVEMIYDMEKANRILNSNLSAPTDAFPVCLCWGGQYSVFPTTLSGVELRYYRRPFSRYATTTTVVQFNESDGAPVLPTNITLNRGDLDTTSGPRFIAVSTGAGVISPNPTACRNFDLPSHLLPEVVYEMCQLIGINLRDGMLSKYGISEAKTT